MITEPEAAATFLLGSSLMNLLSGETFIVLDCGGGTVDAVTYTLTTSYPLALKTEAGKPTGDNCGGSDLNQNFQNLLLDRLAEESYLDRPGQTRLTIVERLIPDFENYDKRKKDLTKMPSHRLLIPGIVGDKKRALKGLPAERFEDSYLLLNVDDYKIIFVPLLERVGALLEGQLTGALVQRKVVNKVFLVGGFGAAPALRSYLSKFLQDFAQDRKLDYDILLVKADPQSSVTAVASGAVLSALNKNNGPERPHQEANPVKDEVDGLEYVTVVDYFVFKGSIVPPVERFGPIPSCHTFDARSKEFRCEEVLLVSDSATESHYTLDHVKNHNRVKVAGKILVDMSFLIQNGNTLPIIPALQDDGTMSGKPHYRIQYDLLVVVEGRNMRYEVRYPPGANGQVRGVGQISIAAAFRPGSG